MTTASARFICVAGWDKTPPPHLTSLEQFFFNAFIRDDVTSNVANVRTRAHLLEVAGHVVPVTVNWREYDNSFVCSPYSTFVRYLYDELALINNPWLVGFLRTLTSAGALALKAGQIDRVIQVNNWLISTNLYPELPDEFVGSATDFLKTEYPGHAVVFRSLTRATNANLMNSLMRKGYIMIPSRQIYLFEGADGHFMKKRMTRSDLALIRKTPYQFVGHDDIGPRDYERMARLYGMLYLEKHSFLNPQFTPNYIRKCHRDRALTFCGFRDRDGELQAVIGLFERENVMATHFIGYNTQLPVEHGLYRMLMGKLLESAAERKCLLNLSSGAAHFKTLRGGRPAIEYTAVYAKHLSHLRQSLFRTMAAVAERVAVPLMKAYKL